MIRDTENIELIVTVVMIYFAVGAPWGWNITPGPNSTAMVAILPLAIQVFCASFLPIALGMD